MTRSSKRSSREWRRRAPPPPRGNRHVLNLVDTHAHVEELPDVEQALRDAEREGISRVIAMGTDSATNRWVVETSHRYSAVCAAVGHHPINTTTPDLGEIARLAMDPRVVAIGEIGLDGAHPDRAPDSEQQAWFESLCDLAIGAGLPVSVHVRDASARAEEILRTHAGVTGVMHYFSLDWAWATRFLDIGFYLSFSGLITRPSRAELRDVVKRCPADRLLLETDTPFGTPHGRGREPNRPAWLVDTARAVAELRGVSLEELADLESRNAEALFRRLN